MIKLHSRYDREIAKLAVPALGTLVAEPLYVLADTAIVAQLGTEQLGGLALATTVILTLHAVLIFLAYGTTGQVSRLIGAGDIRSAATRSVQGLWLAIMIGVALSIVLFVTKTPLLRLLGADGAVLTHGLRYLGISLIGFPFLLLMMAGAGSFHGRQNTVFPLIVAIGSAVLNLVLELILVPGLGYGMGASALSTVVAQILAGTAYLVGVARWGKAEGATLAPLVGVMRKLLSTGTALMFRTMALRGAFTLAMVLSAKISVEALAAQQISFQIWGTLALSLDSVAIAGQSLTGRWLGAGDTVSAKAASRRMIELDVALGASAGLVLLLTRHWLANVFTPDPEVAALVAVALLALAIQTPVNGFVFALDGILVGAGDLKFLAYAMVGAFAVFASLAITIVMVLGGGLGWLWVAITVFMVIRAVTLGRRFYQDKWLVTGTI